MEVASSIVGILSLGIQVTQGLVDFYSACKAQHSDIADTQSKLNRLLDLLHEVDNLAKHSFPVDQQPLVNNITKEIEECGIFVEKLKRKADKFENQPSDDIRSIARKAAYRVAYPFRQSTLQKLNENIEEIVSHLSLGVQLLTQRNVNQIHDSVAEHTRLLNLVRAEQISMSIRSWLNAPDATVDYNRACKASHPGTGMWFINSAAYSSWLRDPSSFLWLNGFAGCGKTVLCSTVIRHTFQHQQSSQNVGLAFFFFSFSDKGKQDSSAMLKAVVHQLASQLEHGQAILSCLKARYPSGGPPNEVLIHALDELARSFSHVYILLDALDESPRDEHREELLDTLHDARRRLPPTAHLLVTSRNEIDIREMLTDTFQLAPQHIIPLRNASIDEDIKAYIQGHLKNSHRMRRLKDHHTIIEQALTASPRRTLPVGLDKTYEQMLSRINLESTKDAIRILRVLCCATRPLKVAELIDAVAIDLETDPRMNPDARLFSADELLRICPGFLDVYEVGIRRRKAEKSYDFDSSGLVFLFEDEETESDGDLSGPILTQQVRLAHFSIQEYLESERAPPRFRVDRLIVHTEMASMCLSYLLESPIDPYIQTPFDEYINHPEGARFPWDFFESYPVKYPLLKYGSTQWPEHYRFATKPSLSLKSLVLALFLSHKATFDNWVETICYFGQGPEILQSVWQGRNRLHLAVHYDLDLDVIASILHEIPDSLDNRDTIGFGFIYPGTTPLGEACNQRNEAAVRFLLNEGASIREPPETHTKGALARACTHGDETIVQIILDHSALDVESVNEALVAASRCGYERIVEILLGQDTHDVNGANKALYAASKYGYERTVQILLGQNTHDVNGINEALRAASMSGHERVVQILLDHGALASAIPDEERIVQLLVDHGGYKIDGVVWYAFDRGYKRIIRFVLGSWRRVRQQSLRLRLGGRARQG